jgi:tungstate transport system ATP-binding protein
MLYELRNITKYYDGRKVLDLSLSLEKGRVTGLIGPNGAGKTTLLEILAFLNPPTSGEFYYDGSRLDFDKADVISLRRSAVLVQQKPILFTTSVFGNVEFPLKIRNLKKGEREKAVDQLLAMVGMDKFSRARAHRLSGGETQRVSIAQALACSPEVILMDEPTASVDAENQIIIERIIHNINRVKGISVIFTTHDKLQASRIADNIVFIYEGKVSEAIHENIFSGFIAKDFEGNTYCTIKDGLKIPLRTERTGHVRISLNFDAGDIIMNDIDAEARHSISGNVIQLSDEKGSVRMIIDAGIPLTVIAHPDDMNVNFPRIGERIRLKLHQEKIEIL